MAPPYIPFKGITLLSSLPFLGIISHNWGGYKSFLWRATDMIVFDKLWRKINEDGVSQYKLISLGISHSTLTRLKKNQAITTETLNKLCKILNCDISDIAEYRPD